MKESKYLLPAMICETTHLPIWTKNCISQSQSLKCTCERSRCNCSCPHNRDVLIWYFSMRQLHYKLLLNLAAVLFVFLFYVNAHNVCMKTYLGPSLYCVVCSTWRFSHNINCACEIDVRYEKWTPVIHTYAQSFL